MNKIERLLLDSDLLNSFVAIAECQNLTLAAGQLGRTQSAISVQLRKLETTLDTSLFTRTAKGMSLTPAGELLLPKAKTILADLRDTAKLFQSPLTGSIRFGLPDDFDDSVLEQILFGFSHAHPGVQVLAKSGCTAGFAADIENDLLDVAVSSNLGAPLGEPLGKEPIVWAGRAGKVWPKTGPVPLALLDRACAWRDLPKQALDKSRRAYTVAFQSSSFPSLQAALRAGVAIGLLPRSSVDPNLQILTPADGFPPLPASYRSLLISPRAPSDLTQAMTQAIRSAYLQ